MQQNKKNKKENADTLRENFEDKLPKNVRQIGNISQNTKIYIEDYVLNYLKRVQKENHAQEKKFIVVLVGKKQVSLKTTYYFVSGAVILNVNVRENSKAMPESVKKQLERTIETYFGKGNSALCQLGWGSEMLIADKIPSEYEMFHRENFGSGNMLFLGFNEDFEENFYISENGKLKKQGGYYIYFDRNEGMQQYVQDNQPAQSVEEEPGTKSNSERYKFLLANHKEEIQKKRIITFLYTASTFLVMVVIVLGVTLINHYDKLKDMQDVVSSLSKYVLDDSVENGVTDTAVLKLSSESALNHISQNDAMSTEITENANQNVTDGVQNTNESTSDAAENTNQNVTDGTENVNQNVADGAENVNQNITDGTENANQSASDGIQNLTTEDSDEQKAQGDETASDADIQNSPAQKTVGISSNTYEDFLSEEFRCYEVKDGDTLSGICRKLYGSLEYFDKICEYNHIENTDEIKVGQKIWVP